jgi:putative flippase GtrA
MRALFWARVRSIVLFGVAGVLALLIDIGVLYVLKPSFGLYGARGGSFACAATFTWLFNRHLTFKGPRSLSLVREYLAYMSSMAVGGVINYAAYAASVSAFDAVARQPFWGVAIGSLVGMGFNYLSASRIMKGP